MLLHVSVVLEGHITCVTGYWLLSLVDKSDVSNQTCVPGECLAAHAANVICRSPFMHYSNVLVQAFLAGVAFITQVTLVSVLAGVSLDMPRQFYLHVEGSITDMTAKAFICVMI